MLYFTTNIISTAIPLESANDLMENQFNSFAKQKKIGNLLSNHRFESFATGSTSETPTLEKLETEISKLAPQAPITAARKQTKKRIFEKQ